MADGLYGSPTTLPLWSDCDCATLDGSRVATDAAADTTTRAWVSPAFENFIKRAADMRRLARLRTEANVPDRLANLYVDVAHALEGDGSAAAAAAEAAARRFVPPAAASSTSSPSGASSASSSREEAADATATAEEEVAEEGGEDGLWAACKGTGWPATLFKGIVALRLRPGCEERRREAGEAVAHVAHLPHIGEAYRRFAFLVAEELLVETAEWRDKASVVAMAEQAMAAAPHDPVYFGAWMRGVAMLGPARSSLLAGAGGRCRTVAAALEAAETTYYSGSLPVSVGLARLLLEVGENETVVRIVDDCFAGLAEEEAADGGADETGFGDASPAAAGALAFARALARLRLAEVAADPEAVTVHVGGVLDALAAAPLGPRPAGSNVPLFLALMVQVRRLTPDADRSLTELAERAVVVEREEEEGPPGASARTPVLAAYCFLLTLAGRAREARCFLERCRRECAAAASPDYPYSALPDAPAGEASHAAMVEALGCHLYEVECLQAYARAFAMHSQLLAMRRAAQPVPAALAPGDAAVSALSFDSVLASLHEFVASSVLWSTMALPSLPPSPTTTAAAAAAEAAAADPVAEHRHVHHLPAPLDRHADAHLVVPARDGFGSTGGEAGVDGGGHRHGRQLDAMLSMNDGGAWSLGCSLLGQSGVGATTSSGGAEQGSVPVGILLDSYHDKGNASALDNKEHDLNEDLVGEDRGNGGAVMGGDPSASMSAQAAQHFAALDASRRGFVTLRTAVQTIHRYLHSNGFSCSVEKVCLFFFLLFFPSFFCSLFVFVFFFFRVLSRRRRGGGERGRRRWSVLLWHCSRQKQTQ